MILPQPLVFCKGQNVLRRFKNTRIYTGKSRRGLGLDRDLVDEIVLAVAAEDVLHQTLEFRHAVIADLHKNRAVFAQQPPGDLQPVFHEHQPCGELEIGVVGKGVLALFGRKIIGRINVDALNLALIALEQGGKRQEVVALEDQIVLLGPGVRLLHPLRGIAFGSGQHLRLQQAVHLVGCQGLIVENFLPPGLLLGLPALQDAVLIGKHQFHIARRREQFSVFLSQTDFVFKSGIAVREELAVIDDPRKLHLVKNPDAVHFCKKSPAQLLIAQQPPQQVGIHLHGRLIHRIAQECPILSKKTRIRLQHA